MVTLVIGVAVVLLSILDNEMDQAHRLICSYRQPRSSPCLLTMGYRAAKCFFERLAGQCGFPKCGLT
jgi:hypothetical protein